MYKVEHLRNVVLDKIHISCLKFCQDDSIDTKVIMSHGLISENGMAVQPPMYLKMTDNGLMAKVNL